MSKVKDLRTIYKEEVVPKLKEALGKTNINAIPTIKKVVINSGIGTYLRNTKDYSPVVENISAISGQKAVANKARISVSNFKLREGSVVGASVTLRGKKMWDFLSKLINIVFPRVRDFRGISPKSFDGNGNFSVGFKEHTVFPEISPDDVINIHGVQVNICTSANNNQDALELLKALGFPFKK
jgi:large subunit ribosomal protein L5